MNGDLYVEIPSRCRLGDVVYLAIWATGWGILGAVFVVTHFVEYLRSAWILAVTAATAFWGIALAQVLWKLAYWLAGSERLRVSAGELTIERGISRFCSRRTIPAPDISACRVSPRQYWIQDWHFPNRGNLPEPDFGAITVIHRRKAVRFGRNLSSADAEELASDIANCLGSKPDA